MFTSMFSELKHLLSAITPPSQTPSASFSPINNTQNPTIPKPITQNPVPQIPTRPIDQNTNNIHPTSPAVPSFIDLTNHSQTPNLYHMATRFTKIELPRFNGDDLEG